MPPPLCLLDISRKGMPKNSTSLFRKIIIAVKLCAIYKYGNDDALRVSVFFFFLSNSMPILAATIRWRMIALLFYR